MNTGVCVFCGMPAARDENHPTTDGTVGVCVACGTVLASWLGGEEPGTYALGPPGERTFCDVCGLPIAKPATDLRRDVDGAGDDRPAHHGCIERGPPPEPSDGAITAFLTGDQG